ncbi:toxin-antitoxin system YwqK family antitoxin [Xanthomarina sp. F2636L]|uniref:toxin-antitoxin system YwqK family antitoxin n=1 Tax=Xanthomarina sp. F2636L TaxID=2996018 RepID=UPI00225E3A12|nr:toxin-antitoxin system YwqK family antitoxin [Xanthomarina sp. F2636L]MCX7549322.1 toxin-antitoxin system YwqK family antitoxin [Xanthomarina sp. F2636L]
MKQILVILFLFIPTIFIAQNINQLDENGKRHGIWKKNFDKTQIIRYEGEFYHGKEIGVFKFYKNINNEAVLTATKHFNDKDNLAEVTYYASNGKVISKGIMNGKDYQGEWTYYHKNSTQVMTSEHYNNQGQLDGESLVYYNSGQLAEKRVYKDNKLQGKATWYYENGNEMKTYVYSKGLLHGEAKFYDATGALEIEGQYKNDRKDGIWKYYKNGELTEEKDFTVYSKNPYLKKD